MAPLYPGWSNTAYRTGLLALVVIAGAVVAVPMLYVRTTYNTSQFVPRDQPVEFDHRHHVRDDGIECLYCHPSAERSASAGVPTTAVCMGCHAQVWRDSPLLAPVRRSWMTGQPIRWRRVHDLPDFVYFDHSVHVRRGIDCARCHGDVGRMARVEQVQPLTMGWCLDCHRESAAQVADEHPPGGAGQATLDLLLDGPVAEREVTALTTCTACHR